MFPQISPIRKSRHLLAEESGWKALKIRGQLDFSMIGMMARISGVLADEGISVFVISTNNTDYILLKAEKLPLAWRRLNPKAMKYGSRKRGFTPWPTQRTA